VDKILVGIPILNRLDLLKRCVEHIDYPAHILVINNNSTDHAFIEELSRFAEEANIELLNQQRNLGVAASWNLIIRTGLTRGHGLVFIGSNDTFLYPGSLSSAVETERKKGEVILHLCGWNFFLIHKKAIETVGWFDENFYPAYKEDQDYAYRCALAGVTIVTGIPGASGEHLGSQTIRSDSEYFSLNTNTHFNWNRSHYIAKWGGDAGCEEFRTPYNEVDKDLKWWPDPGESIAVRDWDNERRRKGALE
jgi:GT2 family glycosyltransferase